MRVNRYFIQMKSWVYYILIRNRNRPSQLCAKTVHFCACRLFFQSNFFCAKFGVDSEWNRDSYVESESTPKMLESPKLFMRRVRRRRRVEKSKDFLLGYLKNELFMIFTDTRVPDCLWKSGIRSITTRKHTALEYTHCCILLSAAGLGSTESHRVYPLLHLAECSRVRVNGIPQNVPTVTSCWVQQG